MKPAARSSQKPTRPPTLWEYSVTVRPEDEERIAAWLQEALDCAVASVLDVETGQLRVLAYLPSPVVDTRSLARSFEASNAAPDQALPRLEARRLAPQNWAESWKRHFKPLSIRNALLIRASWHHRPAKPGQRVIILDPGLSFGTGHHPTTRFCLSEIVRLAHRRPRQSFLDLGTGSGLLSLAAVRMGYQNVTGIDIDPQAVRIATLNARRNRLDRRARFLQADIAHLPSDLPIRPSKVVCANLVFDLLIQEKERIASLVTSGGHLVLAGILDSHFANVEEAYMSIGFRLVKARTEREWRSATLEAPSNR